MTQEWVDVSITSGIDPAELLGLLDDDAVQGAWEDQGMTHLYWSKEQWNGARLNRLAAVLDQLDSSGQTRASMQVGGLPHQDWNRQWAESVKPLAVGRRIVIRPSWTPVALEPGQFEIILDPKQAFGTGHHATTRMLLEWLEDRIQGGETVLDVGAGSGILAMVALRLGARSAIGVELDPVAVACARDYAVENRFGSELTWVCGTLRDMPHPVTPDLVLANLDRQTLLLLAEDLAEYGVKGARLFLSGVLTEQEAEVCGRYAELGLYCVARREQEGWVALELRGAESCEGSGGL